MVNKLVSNEIGNIVVGYNKGWKDSINIGRRNNQTFVQISFDRFIEYLKYKCELTQEEIKKHETYLGKRVKRAVSIFCWKVNQCRCERFVKYI